jgi:hypothetical protein
MSNCSKRVGRRPKGVAEIGRCHCATPPHKCSRVHRVLRIAGLMLVPIMAACNGGEGFGIAPTPTPQPPPPPGLTPSVTVSRSGDLSLEQYDRSAKASAVFSRSSRFTLIPEGATP